MNRRSFSKLAAVFALLPIPLLRPALAAPATGIEPAGQPGLIAVEDCLLHADHIVLHPCGFEARVDADRNRGSVSWIGFWGQYHFVALKKPEKFTHTFHVSLEDGRKQFFQNAFFVSVEYNDSGMIWISVIGTPPEVA